MLKRVAKVVLAVAVVVGVVSLVPVHYLPWYPETSGETLIDKTAAIVEIPIEGSLFNLPVIFAQERKLGDTTITGTVNYCADAGANDSYACNMSPALPAYTTGACYVFKANTANTGAATIAFNGLSAITIKKVAGGVTTDLSDNDIRSGQVALVCYDGTNMQLQSTLGNAAAGTDSGFAFVGSGSDATLTAGQTVYATTADRGHQNTISYTQWSVPATCTARDLRITTLSAQPGTGTLVATVRNVTSSTDTALVVTISAGSAAGTYSNTSDTASITGGNNVVLKFVNNASGTSAQLGGWSFRCN